MYILRGVINDDVGLLVRILRQMQRRVRTLGDVADMVLHQDGEGLCK